MAKVLFINPIVREEDVPRHVPYGIALIAAITIKKGHQVQIYDHNAWRQPPEVVREVLEADDWDVVALGGITTTYGSIKSLVTQIRAVRPKTTIVLGGGVLTSLPREMMTWLPAVDIGVVGEAFQTFPDILEMFDSGQKDFVKIPGTISRRMDGGLVMGPPRTLLRDLDSLPYPAWELFPLEEVYFHNSEHLFSVEGMLAKRRLDINMSYGCSLICRFCYHLGIAGDLRYAKNDAGEDDVEFDKPGSYSRDIRYHSPEYVVKLVKYAHGRFGVDFIGFLDENLMTMDVYSGRTWLKEICRLWKEYGLQPSHLRDGTALTEHWSGVHWSGTSHATLCTLEILREMRSAGCAALVYGYESFSPQVMKRLGKGATPTTNIRSFFWSLEAGVRPIPNMIIGFPSDDFDSIRASLDAWKELGIIVRPHFATPYPGSEWFHVYRKSIEAQYKGDLEKFILDLGDATKITGVISHNFNAVELLGLRELMLKFDYARIDEYEALWRAHHRIPEGAPSTLYQDPVPLKLAS
ncbi:MAG: B12-binding domain-containing radical SAM protein [Rhodospirillales bacterium]|nr:B12-binding domain-containing radical SAM protein [Rhodospirillales bacterium]